MANQRWSNLALFFWLTSSPLAVAQPAAESELTIDDCRLEVLDEENRPDDTPGRPTDDTLTEALDPCDGVIEPPPVGDQELTISPPAGGETPVIPPSQLPEQQP